MSPERRIARLRLWVLVLTIVVVFGAITAPIIGQALIQSASRDTQIELGCQIIRAQNVQLGALQQIRRELGLPGSLPIPEVPTECAGL